jgi:hypothetical protein
MIDELLEDTKPIEISPELAVAHSVSKSNRKKVKSFGSTLPSASLEDPRTIDSLNTTNNILKFMQEDLMKPAYRFSPSEIESCKLPKKL